ncbi:MAG: TetR/AcrR family transcriptional regulator [Myxococcales bacterium]|nr:TetR/AcrR family transcriptional regulator [Myxococcales bacterium]
MGSPLRSRLDMDSRRAQLLELGLRLFGTRAYDEVSIDDIAAAANVSKGLLYHYFGGKRAFYVAVVRDGARRLREAIEPDPRLPPPARALAGLDAYLRFVEERADAYAALVTGGLGADPEIFAILEQTREAQVGRILASVGLHAPRPAYRLALRAWIGGVETACVDWLRDPALPRAQLLALLLGSLQGALASAHAVDPVDDLVVPIPRLVIEP